MPDKMYLEAAVTAWSCDKRWHSGRVRIEISFQSKEVIPPLVAATAKK
jgi:hypothetical protein